MRGRGRSKVFPILKNCAVPKTYSFAIKTHISTTSKLTKSGASIKKRPKLLGFHEPSGIITESSRVSRSISKAFWTPPQKKRDA